MNNRPQYPHQSIPANTEGFRNSNPGQYQNPMNSKPGPFTSMPDLYTNNPNTYYNAQPNMPTSLPEFSYGNQMGQSRPHPGYGYPHQPQYGQQQNFQGSQHPPQYGNPYSGIPTGYPAPYGQGPMHQPEPGMPTGQPNTSNTFVKNLMLKNILKKYADSIFVKHDLNRSGFLDVREIYPALCEVFQMSNLPAPTYPEVIEIMKSFDSDGNGLLDVDEFRNLIFLMNGI